MVGLLHFSIFIITKFLAYQRIASLTQGFGSLNGYRYIWHILNRQGIQTPRIIVQQMLKEIDPEGSELMRRHRLKRRLYVNQGPDYPITPITRLKRRVYVNQGPDYA